MFRSKLLLIMLSGALVFGACSDSSTDSGDDGDNGGDPVEPTATVNNPSDGATLEGEVTFSVDGNSENGFDEARIFVDDQEIETVSDPSLPYDKTINTIDYNNGDYDLRAELDATDQDTTVKASVSVTLENYLLEIDTNGRISQLKDQSGIQDELLFVAAPDGSVLKKVDLLNQSDGTLQILSPSELPDSGAPDHFTLTQLSNTPDDNGNPDMFIITDVGFQPWTDITSESLAGGSDSTPDSTDITMDFTNIPNAYELFGFFTPDNDYDGVFESTDSFNETFTFVKDTENLIATAYPGNHDYSSNSPLFYWEQNLENGQTLSLDVGQDFSQMKTHSVDWPDFDLFSSTDYSMSIDQNSFDSGIIGSFSFNEISSGQNTLYVPNKDHQYQTNFSGFDQDNNDAIFHIHVREGDLPGSFSKLDYNVTHDNESMDDVQLSVSGSSNPDFVFHYRQSEKGHVWLTTLPPDTTQFVFPKLADSLRQGLSSSYDRSTFNPLLTTIHDIPDVDGFDAYFDEYFVLSNALFSFTRHQKQRIHDAFQSRSKQNMRELRHVENTQRGVVPILQKDKWGNRYSPIMESLNK